MAEIKKDGKKNDKYKELREQLIYKRNHGTGTLDDGLLETADSFCKGYIAFLNAAKTEREASSELIRMAEENGFVEFEPGKKYQAGDKIYYNNRSKAVILAVIGQQPVEQGTHIAAAHIDSPRLDLKPNPLFESDELAYFKTHYYGGIKKYQWTTVPLSLHGKVYLKDGSGVDIRIGEDPEDPQFCVTDLLIHLANDQMSKRANDVVSGEQLNVLLGSRALPGDEGGDGVKLAVLKLLNDKYGIVEQDFLSAEIEAVPAMPARDVGLDRSMIGAYGHDDRVCAYPSVMAAFDTEKPLKTAICCLADKEEIGSVGNTGLDSAFLEYFITELAEAQGGSGRRALSNSKCLSADVNGAYDPSFADAFENRNACRINGGACLTKYTGARGKSGCNDASAETLSYFRGLFDSNDVIWQTGELGKVDGGGGGTVALYIAGLDVDTVDLGVPVLSMHAPWEIVSKLDVYETYKAIQCFFADDSGK